MIVIWMFADNHFRKNSKALGFVLENGKNQNSFAFSLA